MIKQQPLLRALIKGFTLVEMMAVLIVVGIAASMVMLSVGDATRPHKVKDAARHLYGSMSLALEDAVFLNKQLGLRFDYSNVDGELVYSYEWLYFDYEQKQWQIIELDDFAKVDLPDFVTLTLEVEGQETLIGAEKKTSELFKAEKKADDKNPILHPDLYFLSSGEIQAFKISVADKEHIDSPYILEGNALGQITFKRPDEIDE
jgi:general secretion pathway protein H